MDDTEDDARYPPKGYPHNRAKKSPLYSHRPVATYYNRHDYVEDEEDEADDDFEDENGVESDEDDIGRGYPNDFEPNEEFGRYPKRQKVKKSVPNYEFVARATRMSNHNNNNNHGEADFAGEGWSEQEKFFLLEVWGERFLQLGRNSLRSSDWVEVAAKVCEALKIQRTESQCRQMMDSLKRRYRKEKAKGGLNTKWAFYRKMDMLMRQENGHVGSSSGGFSLSCGVDSGEYVFMDTGVYLERANMNDEMRDSPCDSEEDDEEEEEEEDEDKGELSGDMFKGLSVLADSVHKFGEIYEKIESSKREQMLELERMRVDFQRELELQKKQILERAQSEIAKIREGEEEEEDDDEEEDDTDTDSDGDAAPGGGGDNVDGEETEGDTGSADNDSGVNVSE